VLKHFAASTKRRLSALPNVGQYIYNKSSGFTRSSIYIYDISRLRVNVLSFKIQNSLFSNKFMNIMSAVENSSCWNLSCLMINIMFVFVSFFVFSVVYILGSFVLTVNPSHI
jgi:hypothetical protein